MTEDKMKMKGEFETARQGLPPRLTANQIKGNKEAKKSSGSVKNFSVLLKEAVEKPGKLLEAYEAFYSFSFYNMMIAMQQCQMRGLEIGPISTFKNWKAKARHVKKGEKAIALYMPIMKKKGEGEADEETLTGFRSIARWFVLAQTDGAEYKEPKAKIGDFSFEKALASLKIKKVKFENINGNIQGYACKREVAVNPLAQLPEKTLFHESAHVCLGHTEAGGEFSDTEELSRGIKEVEAESVALLCLSVLGLSGVENCRGYIQNWLGSTDKKEIPEESARKIITVAGKILRAGQANKEK